MSERLSGGGLCLGRQVGEAVVVTHRASGARLIVRPTFAARDKTKLLFVGDAFEVNRAEVQEKIDAAAPRAGTAK